MQAIASRVVSLVPSLTELVWWLGRGDALVGRTRFCVEPRGEIEVIPEVGGTKTVDVERVLALEPDLVIASREENRREDVEQIEAAGIPLLTTIPETVDEALGAIGAIGERLGAVEQAGALVADARCALAESLIEPSPRLFVPIWKRPLMGLGAETYGHDLLTRLGATNVLAGRPRYPETTLDQVAALEPDIVLLPDEPYRFREADAGDYAGIAPAVCLDGKLLWWYGPRLPASIRGLRGILAGIRT